MRAKRNNSLKIMTRATDDDRHPKSEKLQEQTHETSLKQIAIQERNIHIYVVNLAVDSKQKILLYINTSLHNPN